MPKAPNGGDGPVGPIDQEARNAVVDNLLLIPEEAAPRSGLRCAVRARLFG
jgi:hypothetical protein